MTDLADIVSSAFWRVNPPDADPAETREWLDAFDALVAAEGRERATFLLRKLLEHDASIKLVVLAAASGPGGPGPLVAQLGKREGLGPRPVPVLVVPGALSREEIRKLALPLAEALPHAADAHADPEPPPA